MVGIFQKFLYRGWVISQPLISARLELLTVFTHKVDVSAEWFLFLFAYQTCDVTKLSPIMNTVKEDCFPNSIMENGSCSRRSSLTSQKIPQELLPLDLQVLHSHISRVMRIDRDCVQHITVEDASLQYLNLFLLYFINVKNCMRDVDSRYSIRKEIQGINRNYRLDIHAHTALFLVASQFRLQDV